MTERKDLWWVAPASLALLILILASMAANFQYGVAFGGPIIGGTSIASDILKVVALIGVFALWRKRYRVQAVALFMLFLGFVAWSMLSAVGFMSTHFATLEDSRGKTASQWQTLTAQIEQLQSRRARVDAVRPQKTIQADIDALLRIPGINGCAVIDGPVTREHCPKYDTLKAELGNAEAAAWLDGRLDELRKELAASDRVSVVDPRTDSITAVSGLAVTSVALFIKFFFAGLIELATAIGLWAIWSPFFARRPVAPVIIPRKPYTPSLTLPLKPETRAVTPVPEPPAPTPAPDDGGTPVTEPETKPDDTVPAETNVVILHEPPVNKREEKRRKREVIDRQNRSLVKAYVDERLDTEASSAQISLTAKSGHQSGGTAGTDIYADFRRWCRDNSENPVGKNHFGRFIGEFVDRARNSKGVVYGAVIRAAVAKKRAA